MWTSVPESIDEDARRRFEAAWRQGRPESIEQFLPPESHPGYLATLEELIHIDLEFSWKTNRQASDGGTSADLRVERVESYLSRFPCLNRPDQVIRLLEQE